MACRAPLLSSSHSHCPSLPRSTLPLFFSVLLSLKIYSLVVTPFSFCHFLHVLCAHLPSLSHFHFPSPLPVDSLHSLSSLHSLASLLSHIFLHLVTYFLSPTSCYISLSLCQRGHCAGQTALRSPPATALTCCEDREKGRRKTSAPTRLNPP